MGIRTTNTDFNDYHRRLKAKAKANQERVKANNANKTKFNLGGLKSIVKYLSNEQIQNNLDEANKKQMSLINYLRWKNDPKNARALEKIKSDETLGEFKEKVERYLKANKIKKEFLKEIIYKSRRRKAKDIQDAMLTNLVIKFGYNLNDLSTILGVGYHKLYNKTKGKEIKRTKAAKKLNSK